MFTKEDVRKAVLNLKETKDKTITYYFEFGIDDQLRRWAIVTAWQDEYEFSDSEWTDGEYRIAMKVAYQPTNSLMQEYDIDWTMPYDKETGYVDDCESIIMSESDMDVTIDYMFRIFEEYKAKYFDKGE